MKLKTVQLNISGSEPDVDELLSALAYISHCCMVGHSDEISISFDGDGSANINCEVDHKQLLDTLPKKNMDMIKECIDSGDTPEFSIGY